MRLGESREKRSEEVPLRRRGIMRFFFSSWSAALGFLIVLTLVIVAIFAPQLAPSDPYEAESLRDAYSPPGGDFPLGTDVLGRCILSRIIYGTRISLTVGLVVQGISVILGVGLGVVAGYWEGVVDDIVSNLTNIMFGFPRLLFALAVVTVLGPSLYNTFIALGLAGWPMIARLVRGQTLSVKHKQYVEAARAAGCSDFFIITRHILPQCLSPVLVMATMGVAAAILAEAGLSFLGLGAQPPAPSWGSMIARGRDFIWDSPWMTTYPGAAIFFTVLGFNLLGDGLRDFLDPRL
ncbi:MAG: ABC transporter permease [Bacillota bacterium]